MTFLFRGIYLKGYSSSTPLKSNKQTMPRPRPRPRPRRPLRHDRCSDRFIENFIQTPLGFCWTFEVLDRFEFLGHGQCLKKHRTELVSSSYVTMRTLPHLRVVNFIPFDINVIFEIKFGANKYYRGGRTVVTHFRKPFFSSIIERGRVYQWKTYEEDVLEMDYIEILWYHIVEFFITYQLTVFG